MTPRLEATTCISQNIVNKAVNQRRKQLRRLRTCKKAKGYQDIILNICWSKIFFRATAPHNRRFSEPPTENTFASFTF